jgi:hypothetical protein
MDHRPRRDANGAGRPVFVAELGDRLNQCARPAFVVGPGIDREGAWNEVVALAERHQALVWVTPMSPRCSFPERHRLFAGFLPAIREQIVSRLEAHDLVLALGAQLFTYHIEGFGAHAPLGADVFQIVDDPNVAAWTPANRAIVGSVRYAVSALLEHGDAPARSAPRGRNVPARVVADNKISVDYLMQTVSDLRPADSIIIEEAPSSRKAMQTYLPIERPSGFFTCASGGLGHGLPAATGVALASAGKQRVVGLFGDGSAMYSIQALWSAAQLELPMTVIIINNKSYAALSEFSSHFKMSGLSAHDWKESTSLPLPVPSGVAVFESSGRRNWRPHSRQLCARRRRRLSMLPWHEENHLGEPAHAGFMLSRHDDRVVRLHRLWLPRAAGVRAAVLSTFESGGWHYRGVRGVCYRICREAAGRCLFRAFRRSPWTQTDHGVNARADGRIDDSDWTHSNTHADRYCGTDHSRVPAVPSRILPGWRVSGRTVARHGKRS